MVQTTSHIFSGKVDIESNLLVGSSHLFVDTTNNRVGITTADPDASLHVSGNAYVESNVGVGSTIELDGDTGIITATEFRGDGSSLDGVLTSLQNATEQGSTSDATIQLTNPDTSLVASGNVVISGNVTSLTFIGDGSQLTGVATNLQAITNNGNVTSNTVQFTNTGTSLTASGTIKAAAVQVNGLDVAFDQDMTSNAGRVDVLETDLTSNVTRVTNLEAANVVQETLITNLRTDLDSNVVRVSSLETDRTSNTLRISFLESANIVQESLINNLRTDVTSNTGRIADLESANGVQETLITDLRTDLDSNVVRVSSLEADRTSNTSRISVLESANGVQETLITNLRTDMTSNTSRISVLETDLTDNVTRIAALESVDVTHSSDISSLQSANTVQGDLITDLRTDVTSNTGRIADLETANGVQATLITNLTTDLSSNNGRITSLESSTGGSTLTLQGITNLGNTTTNVVQFSNVTTGLITTANVEIGGDVKISGLTAGKIPYVAADQFLKDSFITTTADATLIASNLDVTGNIFMRGKKFIVESETKVINDAIIGIANNNTVTTTDVGILMQRPTSNVALIHHGGTDKFTIGYTLDDLEATDITNDTANVINVNILGNLYVQNVVTATSFLGDGTTLTGVALSTDMSSNAYRINTIETELGYPTFSTLGLDGIVNRSNATANVIKLINATTGLVADGNVHALKFHGDGSELTGISSNLEQIANNGNVTSNTVQFSNAITSLTAASNVVVTGNVTAGYFVGDGTGITGINLQQVAAVGHTTTTPLITSNTLTGKRTGAFDSKGDSTIEGEVFIDNLNAGEMTTQSISGTQEGAGAGSPSSITLTNPIVITYYGSNWLVNGQSWNDEFHFTFVEGLTYVFDISHTGTQVQTTGPHIGYFDITGDYNYSFNSIPYEFGVKRVGEQGNSGAQFRWTVPRGASSFQGRGGGSHPGPGYFYFMTKPITTGSTSPGDTTERRIRVIPNPDQHLLTGQTQIHGNLYSDSTIVSTNVEATDTVTASDLVSSTRTLISNVATIGTTKTFVVTVSSASGANKYYIDGELQATIELHQNQTYIFDLSSTTLLTHPFVFQTTNSNDGTTNGTNHTTGITSTGVYGSTEKRTFVVPAGAPTTLYYYCTAHTGMGATISISPTAELIVSGRVVASGNVEASKFIGDGSQLTGISGATTSDLQAVTTNGAITTQAIQFTNTGTSLAASGGITAASVSATGGVSGAYFTGDGSNVNIGEMTAETVPYVDSNKQLRDSYITHAPNKTIITSNLEVTGNIFMRGNSYEITSENTVINDRIIGLANNNTSTTLDVGLMLQYPQKNVAIIHHGTVSGSPHSGQLTVGYTQNTFVEDNVIHDANNITLNVIGHVITQNNITVGAQGSYYGDGTTLTGVALETDLSDNVTRISDLETATIISNSSTITTGFTKGDIIYASADNVLNKLAVGGTDGHVLKVTSATNKTLGWAAETGGGGAGSTPWVTNGNKIHYSTDNVGINTSTPAFKLDVHGTANVGALTATSLSVGGQALALESDLAANASRINTLYTEIRDGATAGDIIYADGTNSLAKLSIGSANQVLTVQGGLPAWVNASGGGGGSGGGQWTTVNTNEIHYNGNVGIANADPGHDLSVGSNLFVDDDGSNVLVVTGNTAMSSLTLGQVSIAVSYGLNDILNVSNTSSNIMQLTNATTGLVATGNIHALKFIGDGSGLTGITSNLDQIVNNGNVTSNTVQFSNAITSLTAASNVVVTGNVTAGSFLGDGSLLTGITTIESNVDLIRNTNNTAFINLNSNVVVEFPRSKKLIKYPKVALTQNALNNGYTVTSSTQESSSRAAWKVFNNAYAESDGWRGTGTYSTSNGSFTGTWVDFSSGSQTISTPDRGDWLQIILPEKIRLEAIRLQPRYSPTTGGTGLPSYGRSEFIRNGAIWGSNDGSSWDKVYTINSGSSTSSSSVPASDTSMETFHGINSTTAYNYFVLVITDTSGTASGGLASFSEWELFGTPEYDPEAHGTDVVVKSVPNVPNTDWLDIYIDGQDYSTMPSGAGSVLDKSTNNRHGTPSNVTFNSTWKAFEIESASTSNITIPFNSTGGAYVHTIALWFWMDTTAGGNRCIFTIRGSESTGRQIALIINQDAASVGFKYDFYSANVTYYDPSVVANKWMHVALTYSGGNNSVTSKEIFLNGVRLGVAAQNSNPLNLTGTENLLIGGNLNSGNASFEGMVANFRMFNRVLSKDEIYQLYAYQKEDFGHGDLSMTLKAGRLGIGTSEPRAALDVRGTLNHGIPNVYSQSLAGIGSISASTEEAGYAPLGNDMYVLWGNLPLAHNAGTGSYSWTWYFPNDFKISVLSAVGTLRDCGYGYSYDRSGLGINGYYTNRIAGHTKNNTIGAFTQTIHFIVVGKRL